MFHSKIKFIIVIMFFIGRIIMMYSEQPITSWGEYNYSFWEILKLKKSADKGRYEEDRQDPAGRGGHQGTPGPERLFRAQDHRQV